MSKPLVLIVFIAVMIALIVGIDLLFFRSSAHTWERLASNVGIVLIFLAFYLRFLR